MIQQARMLAQPRCAATKGVVPVARRGLLLACLTIVSIQGAFAMDEDEKRAAEREAVENMTEAEQQQLAEDVRALIKAEMAPPDRMAGLTRAERKVARLLRDRELAADPKDTGAAWSFEVDAWGHLSAVSLRREKACDTLLKMLGSSSLPSLLNIDLGYSDVTDVGIREIGKLTGLWKLDLEHTGITDVGLVHLGSLNGLWTLDLYDTKVTGAGFTPLRNLTGLRTLRCNPKTEIGVALRHIAACRQLSILVLQRHFFGTKFGCLASHVLRCESLALRLRARW